jgi:hypothetical protein
MAGQRLTDKSALSANLAADDKLMIVDTSDTTGSSSGTSKKIDNKFIIQTDKVSFNNTQFTALKTSAQTLIAAPGSGFAINPISAVIKYDYSTSANTVDANLFIGPANATASPQSTAIVFDSFAYNAPMDLWYYGSPESSNATATSFSMINPDNAPFYLLSKLDYNGGGAIDVYITYQIIKL